MYELKPITPRVQKIREKYRNTRPKVDINRYRLVTEFYMNNPQLTGILKRAKNLRNLFENMPILINEDEVIVGWQGETYRCCALYPETSFNWFMRELRAGTIPKREQDPYDIDPEDEKYLLETGDFWDKNSMSAITDEYMPRYHRDNLTGNGVLFFGPKDNCQSPRRALHRQFLDRNPEGLRRHPRRGRGEDGPAGGRTASSAIPFINTTSTAQSPSSARASSTGPSAMPAAPRSWPSRSRIRPVRKNCSRWPIALTGSWSTPAATSTTRCSASISISWPCAWTGRCTASAMAASTSISAATMSQDIANGTITPEYAQELMDLFYLKVAECNKIWSEGATKSGPGYTSGQLMTMGGVDRDGKDATNAVTYMMLQASGPPGSARSPAGAAYP